MTGLTLTLKEAPSLAIDMSAVLPSSLAGKKPAQLRTLKLQQGRRKISLADLFEIEGDADGENLHIQGACTALHRVGANLDRGTLTVTGHCGVEAGLRMRAGTLRISGSVGDGLGLGMRGGLIDVAGSAGDFVGGPAPGDVTGMKNGTILVGKHLGARAGERMRRGVIAVGGNTGAYCGSQMVAGSIVVLGQCADGAGFNMRRGTLLLVNKWTLPSSGFALAGRFELAFLPLLANYLVGLKPAWKGRLGNLGVVERWVGDAANGALGEILIVT